MFAHKSEECGSAAASRVDTGEDTMGAYYTALILDIMRGWIGSSASEDGSLVAMSEDQIAEWNGMEERHEMERQAFLRRAFLAKTSS